MIELSIVLISKNQAWNISRLIESVLQATSSIPSKEIILVDSASTDETVELASRYPISILRLQPGQRLSPAIGRYVGYKRTQGDFVLFLDGDTELVRGWLAHALRVMRDMPRAGAVTGWVITLLPSAAEERTPPPKKTHMDAPREVLWGSYEGGGAALYRRSVLEQVGTFNPYLTADEEPELGLRIRGAKYRILELDYPIVRHYNAPQAISTVLSRRRRNFFLGWGQCFRYHIGSKLLWPYIKERGWWSLTAALGLAAGLATVLRYLIVRDPVWFSLWILALGLLIAGATWRKRSLRRALVSMFVRLLMAEGLIRGFLMKPLPPVSFSANVEVIKEFRNEERVMTAPMRNTDMQERAFNDAQGKDSAKMRPSPDDSKTPRGSLAEISVARVVGGG
jgi:glycosyltransferase involved in cell wall biosynthesis